MKKVLVIGAGFLQSFVIQRAKALGYYVLAVDADPHAVGFRYADEYGVVDIVDEQACLAFAKQHQINGVLTAATDYGVLTAAFIAEQMHLPGIGYEVAKRVKNKAQVRQCLLDAKADDTGAAAEIAGYEDYAAIRDRLTYPVMVKPCDGSGSRGATRVDRKEELWAACEQAMTQSMTRRAMIEPFVFGTEYGVESFVDGGRVRVLGVMKKQMTQPPYYAELGHALPAGLPDYLEMKIRACVEKAIHAMGIRFGSVNMDLLVTAQGDVHIVDVGARMGGNLIGSHIIPLGTGIDYIGHMLRAAVGDDHDFEPMQMGVPVATRLLALAPGEVVGLPEFGDIAQENILVEHHLRVGDVIRAYHTNLDGCGYVVCTGKTMEEADALADSVKQRIDRDIIRKP